jgi:hypothetical protein
MLRVLERVYRLRWLERRMILFAERCNNQGAFCVSRPESIPDGLRSSDRLCNLLVTVCCARLAISQSLAEICST